MAFFQKVAARYLDNRNIVFRSPTDERRFDRVPAAKRGRRNGRTVQIHVHIVGNTRRIIRVRIVNDVIVRDNGSVAVRLIQIQDNAAACRRSDTRLTACLVKPALNADDGRHILRKHIRVVVFLHADGKILFQEFVKTALKAVFPLACKLIDFVKV